MLLLATTFFISWALTWLIRENAVRLGLLDIPNARSSHTNITPRGGGAAIVIAILLALLLMPANSDAAILTLRSILLVAGSLVAVIGFLDDRWNIQPMLRFSVHFVASSVLLFMLWPLPALSFYGYDLSLQPVLALFYGLGAVWLLNLFNFMDGIDGIAAVEAMTALASAALLLAISGQLNLAYLFMLMFLACAGFLFWNWPPASIFMGDVGSGFLGFLLASLLLLTIKESILSVYTWLILLAVFWVDATLTLIWRITTGQRWAAAHRSHLYQVLAVRWQSHRKVTTLVLVVNILWLLPLSWASVRYPLQAPLCLMIALLPLLFMQFRYGIGRSNTDC